MLILLSRNKCHAVISYWWSAPALIRPLMDNMMSIILRRIEKSYTNAVQPRPFSHRKRGIQTMHVIHYNVRDKLKAFNLASPMHPIPACAGVALCKLERPVESY